MRDVNILAVTYNHGQKLKCFINSIKSQTSPNWTLTIIHDGPNQELYEELRSEKYLNDDRISFIQHPERTETYGHILRSIYLSTMPSDGYVVLTNADNYYIPSFVSNVSECKEDFIYWDFCSHHTGYVHKHSRLSLGEIDMGCVAVLGSIATQTGFNSTSYAADWDYFDEVINRNINVSFKKIEKILFIHN